jgi:hypothetical protein
LNYDSLFREEEIMFQIKGPILAAMDLDKGSDELLRQADALARSYKVKLFVCHVLPEIFAVRPLFPQLHLDDALKLYDLEAAVRDALLKRIRTVTARDPPQIEIEIEQGTVHAIIRVCIFWAALRNMSFAMRIVLFLWRAPRLRERYWQRPTFRTPHSLPWKRAQLRQGAARLILLSFML